MRENDDLTDYERIGKELNICYWIVYYEIEQIILPVVVWLNKWLTRILRK